ncbi:hypothetical protein [Rhizobium rhizogenes]|uniref:hypothetical protein n=1 Tax=Rhizobium rhizogenes TaxID=359 RepID=UPI0022BDC112|nr:hypothetical protein [Rhizobium rhizogenes]MCZ7488545.1 hypothetical protein [Rhizobium rhizogenes]
MADLARIKRNVAKMAAQNAPVEDIDGYISSEGVSVDDVRNFKPTAAPTGQHLSFEEGQKLLAADEQKQRMDGASGTIGAALTGVADGVPVAGPLLRGAGERGAAIASTVMNGGTYDENLKLAQDISQKAQEAHPYVTTGANVAGAVAGTAPLIAAAPAAFGARGGSMLARTLASTGSGTVMGAGDSAVRSGGDLDETLRGAKWGFASGLAAPVAANLIGKGAKSLINAGRNWRAARAAGMKPDALSYLTRAATDDGLDAAAVQSRLADMGPDAMLADLGPNLQKQAGALAATPGRAQEIVRSGLADRQAGANARIGAAIDDNLGPRSIVPSEVNATIKANQEALGPQYGEVFKQPSRYDFTAITDDLDKSIKNLRGDAQRGLQRVRDMMNVHNTNQVTTDPRIAFETRQAIDGLLETETNSKAIGALTEARQMLDDALRDSVPRIKEVDANYAELGRQREALQRGQTVLSSGREAPRPSELVREVQEGALPQNMQIGPSAVPLRLSQGARAEVERIVGNNANDVSALNKLIKGEGDWNRARLATLFGQDKADRLIKVLDNERVFADTANTVTRNSETAARIAAQEELGLKGAGFGAAESFKAGGVRGAARSVMFDQASKVAKALLPQSGERAREDLAKALIGSNRSAVVQALMSGAPREAPRAIDPVTRALLIGGGTTGAR